MEDIIARCVISVCWPVDGSSTNNNMTVPATVAAHPVGDGEQWFPGQIGILVAFPNPTHVGRHADSKLHFLNSRVVLPTRTRSPARSSDGVVTRRWLRYVPFVDPRSSMYHEASRLKMRACEVDA